MGLLEGRGPEIYHLWVLDSPDATLQPHTFGPTPAWGPSIWEAPSPGENVPLGVPCENVSIREEHKARDKLGFLVFLGERAGVKGKAKD